MLPALPALAQQSIQFAEPVQLSLKGGATSFDAYGRRFSLTLAANERVLRKLPAERQRELGSYRLLRGSVEGAPGSWVRLTETPRGVEGAIWDGQELYAVTRYEEVAPYLTTPLDAAPGQTVVYRLSDARHSLPRDFCALGADVAGTGEPTGLQQYKNMVAELQAAVITPSIHQQLEIALVADTAFQQAEAADPTAAMLARLNIVEGIFSEQVGLLVLATELKLVPAHDDPFTSTRGATLLDQLGAYRAATPSVRARGLAHLMTGKDLDGTTAGIAYVRTVCDVSRGVSLSQRHYGTLVSSLIMAHELGHNFGAEHDGEFGSACAGVGDGFIMAPTVSGNATFSHCSIEVMRAALAQASCVTAAEFADVSLEAGGPVQGEAGVAFAVPFTVLSAGTLDAQDVTVSVSVPAQAPVVFESASSTQGSCSVREREVTCVLDGLAVGATVPLTLTARGSAAGSFDLQARVAAANDRLMSNNQRAVAVTLRSGIDAALAVTTSARDVAAGGTVEIYAEVSSRRALPVRNATLSLNLNQPVESASLPGGTCTVNASSVSCALAEVVPGASRRLTVTVTARTPGPLFASASVSAPGDGDFSNNSASASAWVQAARDVELVTSTGVVDLPVGAVHEIVYLLTSRGPQPTGDVSLLVSLPVGLALVGIDAGGAACVTTAAGLWRCELGALAPGGTRTARVRVQGDSPVNGDVIASVIAPGDEYVSNNNASVQLRVDHRVDLALMLASGGHGLEGQPFEGQVSLRSQGRQPATGGVLDIELHRAGVLRSARVHLGAACTLRSATQARCALPSLARNAQLHVDYEAEFTEPGSYDVRFAVTAPGDTAAGNDTMLRTVLVRPYLDVAVSGSLDLQGLFGGQAREKTFTVTSGRRGLDSARFVAAHAPPALTVESISAGLGSCRVDPDVGGLCDFIDLPAHGSTTVRVTWRAADVAAVVEPVVQVSTPGDVDSGNDSLRAVVETFGSTDLELRVAETLGGPSAASLSFPLIEVVNGGNRALDPRLEIALPPQVELVAVSASQALCSGTTLVRCDFRALDPLSTTTVSLTVRALAPGRYVSTVRVRSANDTNPGNDRRDVALDITGTVSAQSSGPSGGGGRIEWLMLAALAGLVAWRRVRSSVRVGHERHVSAVR